MTDRFALADDLYHAAVFQGDLAATDAADRVLDAVEADLLMARGMNLHARFLADRENVDATPEPAMFERAGDLYGSLNDTDGVAWARFWTGCYHHVVRDDAATAMPHFEAALAGSALTRSYALRHLGFVAHTEGRLEAAMDFFTASTRLRRELGFTAGVAANLVGMAHVNLQAGRPGEARKYADEAVELAEAVGGTGVLTWAREAKAAADAA
ncbi:hypothetical protein Afil01_17120 [Actinorhabdospora filicis]|uniref:Tetratricopeptide repeat protein n=1 Tax=Actinorhabdospora filicis TaxID=1785913 RepID=A0A9W6SJ48_9ACTN|nr:tetratricopeptide repeat protein [Actinorhabdospora filicis]GLZ76905.1 hypothetical protein Afil01_17120 [Actinorhabdospora filicis]